MQRFDVAAGMKATDAATRRLTALARKEKWGSWLAAVVAVEKVKELEPIIADVIRDAMPMRRTLVARGWGFVRIPSRPTTSDGSRADRVRRAFIERHRQVKAMGLEEVLPLESTSQDVVAVMPFSGMRVFGPFNDELANAVADNAKKLGEVADHERHLAVLIDRFDVALDPYSTPPPFPEESDCLWIVHRWRRLQEWLAVWVARREDSEWRVYAEGNEGGS